MEGKMKAGYKERIYCRRIDAAIFSGIGNFSHSFEDKLEAIRRGKQTRFVYRKLQKIT